MSTNISAVDLMFAKEMTEVEWKESGQHFVPEGTSKSEAEVLGVMCCEFAQKCILDLLKQLKPEFLRRQDVPLTSADSPSSNEQQKSPPANMLCFNDAYRLNFVQYLRPSVMILGAGWQPSSSAQITFVEVQGMSLRKVTDHLANSKANWNQVGQVMLLPDAMWSWRGNLQGLNDFVSVLRQRSPQATVYLCGIPIYDPVKIEPWQLHWIKLFNQYIFKICAAASTHQLQVFYMGKFIKEHKNDWQPGKSYYPKPEAGSKIVSSLVRVFENLAEKRLGITMVSQQQMMASEEHKQED